MEVRLGEHYSTCPFIDKIVYYKNAMIEDQVDNALAALKDSNIYSFENKMDILMEEHCGDVVRKLEEQKVGHGHGSIYDAIFRGELLSFATKVVHEQFIGSDAFVVTLNGGIVHRDAVRDRGDKRTFECELVHEIAAHNIAEQQGEETFDEHEFDPEYEDDLFKEEMEYINDAEEEHAEHDAEFDANLIFEHAMSENKQNLKRVIMRILYWYHSNDFEGMSKDQIFKIIAETQQFVTMLANHDLDIPKWPANFVAYIEKKTATIRIGEIAEEDVGKKLNAEDGLIESKLLNALFKVFVQNKNAERRSFKDIKDGLKKKTDEMKQRRKKNEDKQQKQQKKNEDKQQKKQQKKESGKDREMARIVELVWDDIFTKDDINMVQRDIWKHLDEHCELKELSSYNVKQVKTNIIRIVENMKNGSMKMLMKNPVIVTDDGSIQSLGDAVEKKKKYVQCQYVAHLLHYSMS